MEIVGLRLSESHHLQMWRTCQFGVENGDLLWHPNPKGSFFFFF